MKCQSQFVKTMAAIATFTALSLNLSAQGLRGTVKDQAGEPVIGATVIVDGQSKGTVTDIDGNFTLKSASNLNGNLNCSKELEHYAS